MTFTIFLPNYSHFSAGVAVLWKLGNILVDLGHETYYFNYSRERSPAPSFNKMHCLEDNIPKGVIVVPEVVQEILAPHVRWVLNKPGLLSGPKKYPEHCKIFHYNPDLEASARTAAADGQSTLFCLGICEKTAFNPDLKQYDLWYRGKYQGAVDLKNHEGSLQLTRYWPPTKEEYHDLLARARTLKSYDNFSSVLAEALLAGVEVKEYEGGEWREFVPSFDITETVSDRDKDLRKVAMFVDEVAKWAALASP